MVVEGGEIVVRYHHHCPLVEAPFHRMIEFLAKYTRSVECVSAAMRGVGRAKLDVWGIVGNGKVESQVFSSFGVLLFREAECT